MNIETLSQNISPAMLHNSTWEKADFYLLCSDSEFWGCASIVEISKSHVETPSLALIYLMKKELYELKHSATNATSIENLIQYLREAGYFPNPMGKTLSIEQFWDRYIETIESISTADGHKCLKNGEEETFYPSLHKERVLNIISYANEWNNQQYFIESNDKWTFLGWSTSA